MKNTGAQRAARERECTNLSVYSIAKEAGKDLLFSVPRSMAILAMQVHGRDARGTLIGI
jgi:hypothetical protein